MFKAIFLNYFIDIDFIIIYRSKEEIIKQAYSRLGEKGYSLFTKNCQHFTSECRNGKSFSPELTSVCGLGVGFSALKDCLKKVLIKKIKRLTNK